MLVAPTGTPGAIVQRVNRSAGAFIRQPAVVQRMHGFGLSVPAEPPSPEAMNDFVSAQREHWSRIFKTVGFKSQ